MMSLAACAKPGASKGVRVGLITPGSIADAAWNSGAYEGLQRIRDSLGLAVSHVEARTPSDQDEALRTYAAQGYDLVFAHGFEFQDPAERVSAQYPKTVFIITSGRRAKGNVAPLIFRLEEASYLAGMLAGGLTRNNILGFVGGIELPPIEAAYQGWVNGARATNPRVETRKIYLNSFDDAAAGKEAALALIRIGADMFHHNADAAALGVFQAAKEAEGVYLFGSNDDQAHLAPERVIGSAVIDLPRALLMVAGEVKAGTFRPKVEAFGLSSGVIRYVPNPALETLVHQTLRSRVQAAADSIAAGTLIAAPRPASMQASLIPGPGSRLRSFGRASCDGWGCGVRSLRSPPRRNPRNRADEPEALALPLGPPPAPHGSPLRGERAQHSVWTRASTRPTATAPAHRLRCAGAALGVACPEGALTPPAHQHRPCGYGAVATGGQVTPGTAPEQRCQRAKLGIEHYIPPRA